MSTLRDTLDSGDDEGGGGTAPDPSDVVIAPEEFRLFLTMRERMRDGARVRFREDHEGELIAIESVLHRAEDFA